LRTFEKIVGLAKEQNVDLVLISGDFFDSNKVSQYLIQFVKEQFAILEKAGIRACILPGTHDALIPGEGIYLREQFHESPNVFVFHDQAQIKKEYPDLSVTIWGKVYQSNVSEDSALLSLTKNQLTTPFNIMMAHGSLKIPGKFKKDDWPFSLDEIANSSMDYIALGHWHGAQDVSSGGVSAWYAGSPEITSREEKGGLGAGFILIVELAKEAGGGTNIRVEPQKVGSKALVEEDIDVTGIDNEGYLKDKIKQGASPSLIKIVHIKGLLNPSIFFDSDGLVEELKDEFFHLKINMMAHVATESISEDQYPKELIVGQYVRIMQKKKKSGKV
jgi:DNA repair exonuclease SbcCD nuclease subunit